MATEQQIIMHAKGYLDRLSQGVDPLNQKPVPEGSVLSQENLKKCFAYVSGILQQSLPNSRKTTVDLRVLKHAKTYIDALSRGVDPLSGRAAPDDATLRQERLKKCFLYVSGVLQRVIEAQENASRQPRRTLNAAPSAGGSVPPVRTPYAPPAPADLEPEPEPAVLLKEAGFPERMTYLPEADAPTLGQVRQNFRSQLNQAGLIEPPGITYFEWLKRENILTPPPEENAPWPVTEHGRSLGFSQMEPSEDGVQDITWTVCSEKAQRLLAEKLPEIYQIMREHLDRLQAAFTPEVLAALPYSEKPITLRDLTQMCNRALPDGLPRRLQFKYVAEWLEQDGILCRRAYRPDLTGYIPTERGKLFGVTTRVNNLRTVVYSWIAQKYVTTHMSDILDRAKRIRKPKKAPFVLPPDLKIPITETPQTLSAFSYQVNDAIQDQGGTPLMNGAIRVWLMQEGLLELFIFENFFKQYLPSPKGEGIGLLTNRVPGGRIFILLSEAAQRFVVDHLQEIGEMQLRL